MFLSNSLEGTCEIHKRIEIKEMARVAEILNNFVMLRGKDYALSAIIGMLYA